MKLILKLTIAFSLIVFSLPTIAQVKIQGTIIHSETGEPVPYAYVKKKKTNRGAITNEDGYFQLLCEEGDTLVISFVSFQKQELPYTYFIENDKCFLKPSSNELATVEVYANFDFLYALFDKARKNLKQSETYSSKAYFSLESSTRGIPVEMLECYYNADISPSGIDNLGLKNGRVGMSQLDGIYFASLNTTDVISDYRLLTRYDSRFPDNPLQLSKSRLKRNYRMRLLAFEDGVYKLRFKPKKAFDQHFTSTIWIDKESEQIVKIKLSQKNMKKHPFVTIDPAHTMDSLYFNIAYTFSNDASQSLDKIEFDYQLNYNNGVQTRKMSTGGVFLFFEKNAAFDLPYYSLTGHTLSDYDKIVSQPYNQVFWDYNEVISPSKKSIRYRDYFRKNGVLLNFDELSKHNSKVFKNRVAEWNESRVLMEEINSDGDYYVSRENDYHQAGMLSDFYDMKVHIYLDRNQQGDSVHYLSRTLIDLDDSYYYLEPNKNTACILNLYIDLVEIERRSMMEILESGSWSKSQVDSIYTKSQKWLETNLKYFWKDVEHGDNEVAVEKYIKVVNANLGVDNSLLIWSDYMAGTIGPDQINVTEPWVELYNYGTALLQIGKYEDALIHLEAAYEMGSRDPWLLYNLGLTYLKLERIKKGCEFLTMSKEMGEEVPKELLSECE